ncbi:hypothetical protein F8S13_09240 [Chloroflexia bacterium SDU3-3]|nr:hypothetical protein F8S13_09240 [Chloroflexia bacterium SDU3-3]
MFTPSIVFAIVVAVIGFLATIRAISTSKLSERTKRLLLIPSWVPWMALALGAPLLAGAIPLPDVLNMGGGMTAGLMVAVVVASRQRG